jgi:hypothetical protein
MAQATGWKKKERSFSVATGETGDLLLAVASRPV